MKRYRLLSYTNKLITINYQQFLLYSERKVIIYRKLMIQLDTRCSVSSQHGVIQEKCHSRKAVNCQVHQGMKPNAGLKTNSNSKTI